MRLRWEGWRIHTNLSRCGSAQVEQALDFTPGGGLLLSVSDAANLVIDTGELGAASTFRLRLTAARVDAKRDVHAHALVHLRPRPGQRAAVEEDLPY